MSVLRSDRFHPTALFDAAYAIFGLNSSSGLSEEVSEIVTFLSRVREVRIYRAQSSLPSSSSSPLPSSSSLSLSPLPLSSPSSSAPPASPPLVRACPKQALNMIAELRQAARQPGYSFTKMYDFVERLFELHTTSVPIERVFSLVGITLELVQQTHEGRYFHGPPHYPSVQHCPHTILIESPLYGRSRGGRSQGGRSRGCHMAMKMIKKWNVALSKQRPDLPTTKSRLASASIACRLATDFLR